MSIENGLLNLKQGYLYREEICMMNYSEHHTPWENSEDKSEHISSVSFILCTFAAHIYMPTPTQQQRKTRQFHCMVCHYFWVGEVPRWAHSSRYLQCPLSFPHTGIPIPTEHTHSNIIGCRGNKPWQQEAELPSQVQNVEFTHPSAGCSGKRQKRAGWQRGLDWAIIYSTNRSC